MKSNVAIVLMFFLYNLASAQDFERIKKETAYMRVHCGVISIQHLLQCDLTDVKRVKFEHKVKNNIVDSGSVFFDDTGNILKMNISWNIGENVYREEVKFSYTSGVLDSVNVAQGSGQNPYRQTITRENILIDSSEYGIYVSMDNWSCSFDRGLKLRSYGIDAMETLYYYDENGKISKTFTSDSSAGETDATTYYDFNEKYLGRIVNLNLNTSIGKFVNEVFQVNVDAALRPVKATNLDSSEEWNYTYH
ncbi:MAG: hypothetical protein MRY83_08555 [Flavobacteriales bacterium]|nr:hypothetical protein [Flavobacteriales bacterium]